MIKSYRTLLCIASATLLMCACDGDEDASLPDLDFRQEMRSFVQEISAYAKDIDTEFIIIPQNGQELLTISGDAEGTPALEYISAIDAVGREDLFYGYEADDEETPEADKVFMISLCDVALQFNKPVLTTDYCSTPAKVDDSFFQNQLKGYVSFAADHRELDNIPGYPSGPINEHTFDVTKMSEVENFLYLINPSGFANKRAFLTAARATNYDLILIDLFYDGKMLTFSDVESLQKKADGGKRLVIAYMSIGEAEDYRYYWSFLDKSLLYKPNADWPGNYAVKFWETQWRAIIYGNDASYLKNIIDARFDGVYLDTIEAYEYFENE